MRNSNQVKLMMLLSTVLLLSACAPSNQATWSEVDASLAEKRVVAESLTEADELACGAIPKDLNWRLLIAPAGLGNVSGLSDDQVIERTKEHLRRLAKAMAHVVELAESKGLPVSDAARESTRRQIEIIECYLSRLDVDEEFRAAVVVHIRTPFVPQTLSRQLDAKLCAQLKKDLDAGRFTEKAREQVEKDLKENCG